MIRGMTKINTHSKTIIAHCLHQFETQKRKKTSAFFSLNEAQITDSSIPKSSNFSASYYYVN